MLNKDLIKAIYKANKSVWSKEGVNKVTKKGLYEAFYTMVDDIGKGEAYWIRYTMLCPKTDQKKSKEQDLDKFIDSLNGGGSLWIGFFSDKNPSQNFMIKKHYPLSSVEGSNISGAKHSVIKINEHELTIEGLKGNIETKKGKIASWDLSFSHFMEPYIITPNIAKTLGVTNTLAKAAHPNLRISGTITIDGNSKDFNEVPGIQYHTLGDGYKIPWEWAGCHTIKGLPDAYFDFGSKLEIGKATVEFFDGKKRISKWNDSLIKKLKLMKQIKFDRSPTGLTFSVEFEDMEMSGEVSVPKEKLLGVEYLGPLGNKFYCYNSELADTKLVVKIKNLEDGSIIEEKEFTSEKSTSFETIYREPQEGIKYLPWEDQEL